MDHQSREALEAAFRTRGDVAAAVGTAVLVLGSRRQAYSEFISRLTISEPGLATRGAWALADVASVKLRLDGAA